MQAHGVPAHGFPASAEITVPPLAAVWFVWDRESVPEGDSGIQ